MTTAECQWQDFLMSFLTEGTADNVTGIYASTGPQVQSPFQIWKGLTTHHFILPGESTPK